MDKFELNQVLYDAKIIGCDKNIDLTTPDDTIDIIYTITHRADINTINYAGLMRNNSIEFQSSKSLEENSILNKLKQFIASEFKNDDVSFFSNIIFSIEQHIYRHLLSTIRKELPPCYCDGNSLSSESLVNHIKGNAPDDYSNKVAITSGLIGSEIAVNTNPNIVKLSKSIYDFGEINGFPLYINAFCRFDDGEIIFCDNSIFNFQFELNQEILNSNFFDSIKLENGKYNINVGKVYIKYNDKCAVDSMMIKNFV